MTQTVEPVSDPRWADPDYRTARLHGLIAIYGLSCEDISDLTGHSLSLVRHWRSGRYKTITVPVLRSLIYDLMSRANAQQA